MMVLPASRPSAESNTIVIFGPSLSTRVTATHAPTIAARIGITQTSEIGVRLLVTARAFGIGGIGGSFSGMLSHLRTARIPYQARIKRFDREHRKHHHRRKEEQARRRLNRHQRLQLNQSRRERVDEHV